MYLVRKGGVWEVRGEKEREEARSEQMRRGGTGSVRDRAGARERGSSEGKGQVNNTTGSGEEWMGR